MLLEEKSPDEEQQQKDEDELKKLYTEHNEGS